MLDALTHGWAGLTTAYTIVQAPMIVGLMRSRAQFRHYFASPVIAAPLTAITAVGIALSSTFLKHFGFELHGVAQLSLEAGVGAMLGYQGEQVLRAVRRKIGPTKEAPWLRTV